MTTILRGGAPSPLPTEHGQEPPGRLPDAAGAALRRRKRISFLLNAIGVSSFILAWFLLSEYFKAPYFAKLPGPLASLKAWISPEPVYGLSLFTADYYIHILASVWRVFAAFTLASLLGIPLGLFMGWKKTFRDYTFPLMEIFRPIPTLAWVPLAILMWPTSEIAIIFLTFLGSFFATILNTLLGVESIDQSYFRAALCLGAKPSHIFRRIIVPGALPFIFTGLQISMGFAWFSLVAAEMVAGEYGLGYLIWDSYNLSQFPNIVIGMITLGVTGGLSSLLIRIAGNRLMRWKVREEAR